METSRVASIQVSSSWTVKKRRQFSSDIIYSSLTPVILTLVDCCCPENDSNIIRSPRLSEHPWIPGSFQHFSLSFHLMEQVMVKWYNIYNAPGGPSAHAEWSLFVTCLMTLMGYNTERLAWTRNVSERSMAASLISYELFHSIKPSTFWTDPPSWNLHLSIFPQLQFEVPLSPVIAAKKARPSDGGSDEVCESHIHSWEVLRLGFKRGALLQQRCRVVVKDF